MDLPHYVLRVDINDDGEFVPLTWERFSMFKNKQQVAQFMIDRINGNFDTGEYPNYKANLWAIIHNEDNKNQESQIGIMFTTLENVKVDDKKLIDELIEELTSYLFGGIDGFNIKEENTDARLHLAPLGFSWEE